MVTMYVWDRTCADITAMLSECGLQVASAKVCDSNESYSSQKVRHVTFMKATSDASVEWSVRSGKITYGAGGPRDVLIIVSEGDVSPHPDVVRRRAAIELTEEVRGKLENQGIPRDLQLDDLALVKAR